MASPAPPPASPRYWARARRALASADPVMAGIIARVGERRLERRHDPFVSLARAIVGQQLSTRAAQTIWGRVTDLVGMPAPAPVMEATPEALRACGLSARKAEYLQRLADGFLGGEIDPARWGRMEDDAVVADLTRIHGIGRWTAEMFLIFHLMRPDVLPLGDVGIQRAMSLHYGRGRPLTDRRIAAVSAPWRPWRSVATWYLWRSLEAEP